MIASLRGEVTYIDEDSLIVEGQSVGYQVFAPLNRMIGLYSEGSEIFLYTHLRISEDNWQLFGFPTQDELVLFRYFLNVGGIGGKTALSVLNQMAPDQIVQAILAADARPFEQVSGIGKKTAQRIVLELKDKVSKLPAAAEMDVVAGKAAIDNDAVLALVQLGYSNSEAKKAVVKIISEDVGTSSEEVIRKALRLLSKF